MLRKRETVEPNRGERYVRTLTRAFSGDQTDVGRFLRQDRRTAANRTVPAGQGQGDQKRQ